MNFTFFLLLMLSLLPAGYLNAQNAEAEARLNHYSMRIGEQCTLKLFVRYNEGTAKCNVTWPVIKDTLTPYIEVLNRDTLSIKLVDRASVLYEQKCQYTLTCFDSGTWIVPPFRFIVDNDTVWTEPMELYVNTVPVDTTKPIHDLAPVYDVPPVPVRESGYGFLWWWIGIAVLAFAGLLIFLLMRNRKKAEEDIPLRAGHTLLPHEILLRKLHDMNVRKPWTKGETQTHYVELSDLMRSWIVERFGISAMEMTSFQIIYRLRRAPDSGNKISELEHVLKTADLVKFGKSEPDSYVSEKCLEHAIQFVESTAFTTVFIPPPDVFNNRAES